MKEIQKVIEDYPNYSISNLGNLRNNKTMALRAKSILPSDYVMYDLWKNNKVKRLYAHRLVALAFIQKIDGKDFIDYINGIRNDNRVKNLRWCTRLENVNFPLAKLNNSIGHTGIPLPESAK